MQKISKTAAAYLVGGIAIIQLAPVFFNTFPPEDLLGINEDALMQYLFIFVAIGFPLVLILTYLFSSKEDS